MKNVVIFFGGITIACLVTITLVLANINETLHKYQQVQARDNIDYQIMLENDSITIWDGNRYVGSLQYNNNSLDSLLRRDNE